MKKTLCWLSLSFLITGNSLAAFDPSRDPSVQEGARKDLASRFSLPEEAVKNPLRRVRATTRNLSTRLRAPSRYTTTQKEPSVLYKSKTGFSAQLESSFKIESDTLMQEEGRFILRDGETLVTIQRTEKKCSGGLVLMRNCLKEKLTSFSEEQLSTFKSVERKDNREFVLDRDPVAQIPTNLAIWTLVQVGNEKKGFMVFNEKTTQKAWTVMVEGPLSSSLFVQHRELLVFASSLNGGKQDTARSLAREHSRNVKKDLAPISRTTLTQGRRSKGAVQAIRTFSKDFMSKDGEVMIGLPAGFEVTQDNLEEDGGAFSFQKGSQTLEIKSYNQMCDIKKEGERRRKCVTDFSKERKNIFEDRVAEINLLQEQNLNLNLSPAESEYVDDFSRMTTWFKRDNRYAILVTASPTKNNLWELKVISTREKDALLTDTQTFEKILKSLRIK